MIFCHLVRPVSETLAYIIWRPILTKPQIRIIHSSNMREKVSHCSGCPRKTKSRCCFLSMASKGFPPPHSQHRLTAFVIGLSVCLFWFLGLATVHRSPPGADQAVDKIQRKIQNCQNSQSIKPVHPVNWSPQPPTDVFLEAHCISRTEYRKPILMSRGFFGNYIVDSLCRRFQIFKGTISSNFPPSLPANTIIYRPTLNRSPTFRFIS